MSLLDPSVEKKAWENFSRNLSANFSFRGKSLAWWRKLAEWPFSKKDQLDPSEVAQALVKVAKNREVIARVVREEQLVIDEYKIRLKGWEISRRNEALTEAKSQTSTRTTKVSSKYLDTLVLRESWPKKEVLERAEYCLSFAKSLLKDIDTILKILEGCNTANAHISRLTGG